MIFENGKKLEALQENVRDSRYSKSLVLIGDMIHMQRR